MEEHDNYRKGQEEYKREAAERKKIEATRAHESQRKEFFGSSSASAEPIEWVDNLSVKCALLGFILGLCYAFYENGLDMTFHPLYAFIGAGIGCLIPQLIIPSIGVVIIGAIGYVFVKIGKWIF